MSEVVFKNVQLLKGIPVGEFMDTMGFFSASIGSNCVHCHVEDGLTHWEKFAEEPTRTNGCNGHACDKKQANDDRPSHAGHIT